MLLGVIRCLCILVFFFEYERCLKEGTETGFKLPMQDTGLPSPYSLTKGAFKNLSQGNNFLTKQLALIVIAVLLRN
jgi:hypothetical protein